MKKPLSRSTLLLFLALSLSASGAVVRAQSADTLQSVGSGWLRINTGTKVFLSTVSYPSRDTLFAGGVLRSTDAGASWFQVTTPVSDGAGDFVTSRDGYLISTQDNVYRTNDAGASWVRLHSTMPYTSNARVVTPSLLFLVGSNYIGRSTDSGNTWKVQEINASSLQGISLVDDRYGFAVGTQQAGPLVSEFGGGLFRTTDGGLSWTQLYSGIANDLFAVYALTPARVYVTASQGIYASDDSGKHWYRQVVTPHDINAIVFPSSQHGIAVGGAGVIYSTIDSGHTWTLQQSGTTSGLFDVKFFNDSLGIASGEDGTLLRTENGGVAWVTAPPKADLVLSVFPNPAVDNVQIGFALQDAQRVTMRIADASGMLLYASTISVSSGSQTLPLDIHSFPNGTYFGTWSSEKYVSSFSFTINR